jgi:hypothetical protein
MRVFNPLAVAFAVDTAGPVNWSRLANAGSRCDGTPVNLNRDLAELQLSRHLFVHLARRHQGKDLYLTGREGRVTLPNPGNPGLLHSPLPVAGERRGHRRHRDFCQSDFFIGQRVFGRREALFRV